jgi:hypothetical protein
MGARLDRLSFLFRYGSSEEGAAPYPYIYNMFFLRLPKDITRVISRSRDRLLEIRVTS